VALWGKIKPIRAGKNPIPIKIQNSEISLCSTANLEQKAVPLNQENQRQDGSLTSL
jgi:hypothetical protein